MVAKYNLTLLIQPYKISKIPFASKPISLSNYSLHLPLLPLHPLQISIDLTSLPSLDFHRFEQIGAFSIIHNSLSISPSFSVLSLSPYISFEGVIDEAFRRLILAIFLLVTAIAVPF